MRVSRVIESADLGAHGRCMRQWHFASTPTILSEWTDRSLLLGLSTGHYQYICTLFVLKDAPGGSFLWCRRPCAKQPWLVSADLLQRKACFISLQFLVLCYCVYGLKSHYSVLLPVAPLNISCRELWLWDPTLSMRLFLKGHILSGKGLVQWINGMWVMRGRTWVDSCDNALLLAQAVGMLITKTHAVMSRHRKTARPMQRVRKDLWKEELLEKHTDYMNGDSSVSSVLGLFLHLGTHLRRKRM